MAAGITENDLGVIGNEDLYGLPWHRHPNYLSLKGLVPFEEAKRVWDYEVIKIQPSLPFNGDFFPMGNSYAIVRTDKQDENGGPVMLHKNCAEGFTIIPNLFLLEIIKNKIIDEFEIDIESAGTLFDGRIPFINLLLDTHHVNGEDSPTLSRLMFTHGHGGEKARAMFNQIRVVCDNTRRCAMMTEAEKQFETFANGFKHTRGVIEKVESGLIEMATAKAEIREENKAMDKLAQTDVDVAYVNDFLSVVVPEGKDSKAGKTRVENRRKTVLARFDDNVAAMKAAADACEKKNEDAAQLWDSKGAKDMVLEIFEAKDDLQDKKISRSRYALYQAYLDYSDHDAEVRGESDAGTRFWDGMTGTGAANKAKAWDFVAKDLVAS